MNWVWDDLWWGLDVGLRILRLFIFGCTGCSLLHSGFLSFQRAGATLAAACRILLAVASLVEQRPWDTQSSAVVAQGDS